MGGAFYVTPISYWALYPYIDDAPLPEVGEGPSVLGWHEINTITGKCETRFSELIIGKTEDGIIITEDGKNYSLKEINPRLEVSGLTEHYNEFFASLPVMKLQPKRAVTPPTPALT